MKHITILIGSESDKHIADKAIEVLEKYSVPYELQVGSAHREPQKVRDIVQSSSSDVFICIAGLSAALPGFVASITPKPVIGVPVDVKLGGLDSLLAISQMPSGIPVATVGIDNGKNAAYLALRILGLQHPESLRPQETSSIPGASDTSSSTSTPDFSGFPMFAPTSTSTEEKPEEKKPKGDWL